MTNPVSGGVPEQPCSICGGERTRCEAGVLCVDGCDDAFLDAIEAYYDTCRPDGAPADAESKLRIAIAAFWKSRAALERPRPDVCPECGGLAAHWGNCSRWRPALPAPDAAYIEAATGGLSKGAALPAEHAPPDPDLEHHALMARVRDALHAAYQCGTERNRPGFQQIDGALHRFLLGVRGARGAAPLDLEKLAAEVYEDANGQGWHSATRAEQDEYRAKVKRWVGGAAGSPEDAMRAAWDYHLAHHGTPDATCAICVGVSEGERKP